MALARWFALPVLLIVVGLVLVLVAGGERGDTELAGLVLLGLGIILGSSAAFYLVGRSEDRDRATRR